MANVQGVVTNISEVVYNSYGFMFDSAGRLVTLFRDSNGYVLERVPLGRQVRVRRQGGQIVQGCDLYVGRKQTQGGWDIRIDSEWHNPFPVSKYPLDVKLETYTHYLRSSSLYNRLNEVRGLSLGCWCDDERPYPQRVFDPRCHADVLLRELLCKDLSARGLSPDRYVP